MAIKVFCGDNSNIITWFTLLPIAGLILTLLVQPVKAYEFDFGFSTSFSEEYDDNIFLTESNEEEDFITSVTPSFSLACSTQSTNFAANYRPKIEFYAGNSDENETRHNGNFTLDSQLTPRLSFRMMDTLIFTNARDVVWEGEGDREHHLRSRSYASNQLSNYFNSTLFYQIFHSTSLRGGVSYRLVSYDRSEEVDSEELGCTLGIDHQLSRRDTIFFNYRYRRMLYDDDRPNWEERDNDTDVQSVSIGETHRFFRELVSTIAVGVSLIDEEHEDKETDWNAQASLAKDFKTGNLIFSFSRDVSPGSGQGGTTVTSIVRVGGRKAFTKHLSGNFSINFTDEESISGGGIDNEDWGMVLGCDYQYSRRLTGDLSCSFIKQNSNGSVGGDTDNYRARAGINYNICPKWNAFCHYNYYQQNALDHIETDVENNVFLLGIRIDWL